VNTPFLIIADDLSGAADCAVGFALAGLDSTVLLGCDVSPGLQATVLTVDTDSRRDAAEVAAGKARAALDRHGAGRAVIKKIDSTLRGGWVAEVAALQPALGMALVAAAFPELGRVMRDGLLYVHGQRLADTATWQLEHAGREDRPAVQLRQAGLRCEVLPSTLLDGDAAAVQQAVARAITLAWPQGCQALVFDVEQTHHLRQLARATHALTGIFWVGSGGLSRELAAALPAAGARAAASVPTAGPDIAPAWSSTGTAESPGHTVLTVAGSLSPMTRQQIACMATDTRTRVHTIAAAELRQAPGADRSAASWPLRIQADLAGGLDVVLCIGTDDRFDPAEGPLLARHLAAQILPAMQMAGGLVLTGGETARAMLDRLRLGELQVLGESEPGVVVSRTPAGPPRFIATKAGAFGSEESLQRARLTLRQRLFSTHS